MILAESPRRQRVTKLLNWGHWFALANIVIAMVIASIFVFSSPMPGSVLGTFYLLANWFGHIGFMTFFGFVIFILPLCYLAVAPKTIKASASVIAAVGLALLAFDALLYNKTGFHISTKSADLLRNEAHTQINQFSWQQWGFLLLLFLVWLSFQLILANAIWKRIERLQQRKVAMPLISFFVVCFVSSHAIHVWADAALYQPIIKQDNMFPLSYPATAKTTMSRYGLLDLARYQQRKQLQFDPDIHSIAYPANPIYCAVDQTQKVIVIMQTDTTPLVGIDSLDLRKMDNYFSTATTKGGLVTATLFGVPEIYRESLKQEPPVLLALAKGAGMDVALYNETSFNHSVLSQYQTSDAVGHDILIAFLSGDTINQWLTRGDLAQSDLIIATGYEADKGIRKGTLYTNLPITSPIASTEDIVPTVMHSLGCTAPTAFYSTGQNLMNPKRNWWVSTSGERIVVLHNNQLTEVLSNGSYEITDINDNTRSNENLNTDLLSQAIMHLTRFSKQQ